MAEKVILDLDDFASDKDRNILSWLIDFKCKYPDFLVTLFAIPALWPEEQLRKFTKWEWMSLAMHGDTHASNDEVLSWTKEDWFTNLSFWETMGLEHGFKAPNWEMSALGYRVLKEVDWWVAVREHQIKDLPEGMKYYCFETNPYGVHGHTWTMNAHQQEGKFDWNSETKFLFVKDVLEVKK